MNNKAKFLNDVVYEIEAENLIEKLDIIELKEYCSVKMIKHHTVLERLNMQSVKNSLEGGRDYIMDIFVNNSKIVEMIRELFVSYVFQKRIYPKIKDEIVKLSSMKTYICLYHEAIVVNLLENFFYHLTACQSAEDYLVDVIEYCYEKISDLIKKKEKEDQNNVKNTKNNTQEEVLSTNSLDEMAQKVVEINEMIGFSCINIIRYITDHLQGISFPIRHNLMNVKDFPMLMVALMEYKPWLRTNRKLTGDDNIEMFENNRWTKSTSKMPKLEAQVWITLFNMIMNQDNTKKYELTEFRKNNLLRLRKFLNESVYDQIPPLIEFYRSLEQLSISNSSSAANVTTPIILELVPQILNSFPKENEFYSKIGKFIVEEYFIKADLKEEMKLIANVYSLENFEYFMEDPICANCGKDAGNRCSRCKSEWYCGRDCQVKRWKQHKEVCNKLKEIEDERKRVDEEREKNQEIKEVKEVREVEKVIVSERVDDKKKEDGKESVEVNKYEELD